MKKLMALFLALVLVLGLVACAPNNSDQGETGGEKTPVTLTWYTRGPGMQNDTSKVNDAFNKLLQTYEGFEHVTVKFVPVVAKDYAQAVLLAQTTKEPLDILCTVGLNFVDEALNETIVPLDDLLKNTPELVSTLPEWLWNTQKVNGKIYTVPNYQRGVNPFYSYIPAEYQDCIDWEKFCELTTIDPTTGKIKGSVREVASILETYLLNVRKKTGSNTKYLDSIAKMYANPGTAMLQEYVDGSNIDGSSTTFFNPMDPNATVNSIYLTEEYKEACKVAAEWQDKGYFPADVMTIKTADLTGENMMNDVAMVWSYNTSTAPTSEDTQEFYGESFGFDILAHHFSDVNYMSSRWGACGNAITYNCVSPTDAIALLDLINTEKGAALYNMLVFGIEGEHYTKLSDTRIETLDYEAAQGGSDARYSAHNWCVGNTFNGYLNQAMSDEQNEWALEINKNAIASPMNGLVLDTTEIADGIAQCKAVHKEYKDRFWWGAAGADGFDVAWNEMVNKLKAANINSIISAEQSQLDAHIGK